MEKENVLVVKSKAFALDIIKYCEETNSNNVIIKQLIRSGTSIGANIHEGNYASSKADFVAKMHIALKECYETEYWLSLIVASKKSNKFVVDLMNDCLELKKILISTIKTAKKNG